MTKIKVAVGLSGGVDSAVSAYLLKKQGFDISGVYLDCFDEDAPGCRGKLDRQDALKVALHLKIPFLVLDFRKQYKSSVIAYCKKEYLAGRTPNPDVICNRDIKFGLLLDWCVKNGFDYLATGHYADVAEILPEQNFAATPAPRSRALRLRGRRPRAEVSVLRGATPILRIPKDLHKDQTYFLWAVPRQKFSRVLFPLANITKKDVRSVAKLSKIPVAAKPDSTGICFIGEVRVEDFLKRLGVKEKRGEVVIRRPVIGSPLSVFSSKSIGYQSAGLKPTNRKPANQNPTTDNRQPITEYKVVGRHRGVWFYTIGQRHGFAINSKGLTFAKQRLDLNIPPLYVIAKDIKANRLIIGFGPETYRHNFEVSGCNWLASEKVRPWAKPRSDLNRLTHQRINALTHCFVRIRHLGDLIPCSLSVNSEQLTVNGDSPFTVYDSLFTVRLRFAQRGIAAGQSAVFYLPDGVVLGGGVIQ